MSHSEVTLRSPGLSTGMKVTTLKRMDLSDDEDSGPSKYRKLSTEQKIIKGKLSKLSSSSSSDEGSDDSSEIEQVAEKINTTGFHLSNGTHDINENEASETSQSQLCENKENMEPESNEVVSPMKDRMADQMLRVDGNSTVIKREHICLSDRSSNENFQELLKNKSENHSADENVKQINDHRNVTVQGDMVETAQNQRSNNVSAEGAESHCQNGDLNLDRNNGIVIDPQYESEVIITAENLSLPEPRTSLSVNQLEHSYQAPVISSGSEVQLNIPQADSDVNLAQLIWTLKEEFISLKQTIHELSMEVEKQGNILGAVVGAQELNLAPFIVPAFHDKYNLRIPFSRIEDFAEFNQRLLRDVSFCNEFIMSLRAYIDNNVTLAKNILMMLRKYMSKDLVILFTALKPTGTKHVLKDTCFCKCLLQTTRLTIRNGLLPLEHEKLFYKNLSLVVGGAKGWTAQDHTRRNYSEE